MKNRKESFFKNMYKDSWNYLKESKQFILVGIIVFFTFGFIGFIFPTPEFLSGPLLKFIRDLIAQTEGLGALELMRFILFNNLSSAFFGLFAGILFGVYPLFSSIVNGYVIGFVSKLVSAEQGIASLWRLLPHGIFELPAIFISFGLGLKLGTILLQKDSRKAFREFLKNSLKVFIFVILPLLILAAIIEGIFIAFS
jgi:stage II sporulation protein M